MEWYIYIGLAPFYSKQETKHTHTPTPTSRITEKISVCSLNMNQKSEKKRARLS